MMTKLKLTDNTTIPICISWDASVAHGFTSCYQAVWGNTVTKKEQAVMSSLVQTDDKTEVVFFCEETVMYSFFSGNIAPQKRVTIFYYYVSKCSLYVLQ